MTELGHLHITVGPMYSGKTSWLIEEITKFAACSVDKKPLLINHSFDIRSKDTIISSHSLQFNKITDKVDTTYASSLKEVDTENYSVIGVDEIQFFIDLEEVVLDWISKGKYIFCAGLDGDFRQQSFGSVYKLLPLSDSFNKLNAICKICSEEFKYTNPGKIMTPKDYIPAPFTRRMTESKSQVEVGGSDKYIPTCRKHHIII